MARTIEVRILGRIYLILLTVVLTAFGSFAADFRSRWPIAILGLLPLLLIGSRFERIEFDGKRIARRGPFAFLEWLISGKRPELDLDSIEMITTEAIRSRRGLRQIKFFYKIMVSGSGTQIIVTLANSRKSS